MLDIDEMGQKEIHELLHKVGYEPRLHRRRVFIYCAYALLP